VLAASRAGKDAVQLSVTDNRDGIPADALPRLRGVTHQDPRGVRDAGWTIGRHGDGHLAVLSKEGSW
jgi:hypothetical protein